MLKISNLVIFIVKGNTPIIKCLKLLIHCPEFIGCCVKKVVLKKKLIKF